MILYTNALSAVADDNAAAVRVYRESANIELHVMALGEYLFSIGQSRRRHEYQRWLQGLMEPTRVLAEEETSRHHAAICTELGESAKPIYRMISGSLPSAGSTIYHC